MIHTPVNRTFKYGELFNIRSRYSNMSDRIANDKFEEGVVESVISLLSKDGKIDRLKNIRTKSHNLSVIMQENFVNEAVDKFINNSGICVSEVLRNQFIRRVCTTLNNIIGESKEIELNLPIAYPKKIHRSQNSGRLVLNDDSEYINSLIYSICEKMENVYNDDNDSVLKKYIGKTTVHNYSISKIVLESYASNKQHTQFIKPTTVYENDIVDENTVNNGTIEDLVNKMNELCGFNFNDSDFKWFSCGRPNPFFKVSVCITPDMVKSNNMLATYFGKDGIYGDILFKANGEYRDTDKKNNKIESDINDIHEYPVLNIYYHVYSWDVINGQDIMREIEKDDFDGTNVMVVE